MALIKQKTGYNADSCTQEYFNRIRQIHDLTNADIIVGPELAIANATGLLTVDEFKRLSNDLQRFLANAKSKSLIIPGTGLVYDSSKGEMFNRAFATDEFSSYEFDKKASDREEGIAVNSGFSYSRGSGNSVLCFSGRNLGIEICRDHGHARLRSGGVRELDVHLILACNLNGVSLEKTVAKEGGIVALVDGSRPEVSVYRNKGGSFEEINGQENGDYLLVDC